MHNVKHTDEAKAKISESVKRHYRLMDEDSKRQRNAKIAASRRNKETTYRNVMANINAIATAMIKANNATENTANGKGEPTQTPMSNSDTDVNQ